ncbi:inositol monophosphatase family protein [Limosilactobacillus pontis]|uniref:Inositol monophosphatase family protein n=1 Tax=Limosilactobacillus pontis TaxID=35787 RepID=A0ABU7SSP3_9LACO
MLEGIDLQVQRMLRRVNRQTLRHLDGSYQVATKSSYSDLVTTIDRQNEQEIDRQLRVIDPGCRILSEEGFGDRRVDDLDGHVWIVDPLDGTLNFVKQHDHFGIMLALYVDGRPTLAYIMDAVNQDLYHGGNGGGVFKNDCRLTRPADVGLHDSLVAISSSLVLDDVAHLTRVARQASGLRMYGSAAMEMIGVLTGELGAYVSRLKPWDLAPGRVLAEELGLSVKSIDDDGISVLSSNLVLVATKRAGQDILDRTD